MKKKDLPLISGDKIISIYHKVRERPLKSRLNIIVNSETAGASLYESLKDCVSRHPCVAKWKVMNPDLGSNGPDSAVIYLSDNLSSAGVIDVANIITRTLGPSLVAPGIFGLQKFAAGIYGCDLPTRLEQTRVGVKEFNSAGGIISAVLAKAIFLVLLTYKNNGRISLNQVKTIVSKCLSRYLTGWQLIA